MAPIFSAYLKTFLLTTLLLGLSIQNMLLSQWSKIPFAEGGYAKLITLDSSGNIYAVGNNNQLYRSTTNGSSWQYFPTNISNTIQAILSTGSSVFVATYSSGIYKSTNHGLSWQQADSGLFSLNCTSMTNNNQYVLVGTSEGVYRSSNDGMSWELTSLYGPYIRALSMTGGSNFFAASSTGSTGVMYLSTNNGASWVNANSGLPQMYVFALASAQGIVYAAGGINQLYQTTDLGTSWTIVSNLPANNNIFTVNSYRSTVICGSNQKAYVTTNSGMNWYTSNNGIPAANVYNCLVTSSFIIAGTGIGLVKSTDWGASWLSANTGYNNIDVLSVIAQGNNVLLGTGAVFGMYASSNNGNSWTIPASSNRYTGFVNDGVRLYAYNPNLYYTTDLGNSWTNLNVPASSVNSYFVKDSVLFAGTASFPYIYKSTNWGLNWSANNTGISSNLGINSFVMYDTTILVSIDLVPSGSALYSSSIYGSSWSIIPGNGLSAHANVMRRKGNYLIAGSNVNGVYLSTNAGLNWVQKNNGIPSIATINSLLIINDSIYAGSDRYGIFKSTNNCENWATYSDGLTDLRIFSLYGTNTTMFAGGEGALWRRDYPVGLSENNNLRFTDFRLNQNFPNPFNPSTVIEFVIPDDQRTVLTIYNVEGRIVTVLVNADLKKGRHTVNFDGTCLASGIYFYKLESGNMQLSKKMIFVK